MLGRTGRRAARDAEQARITFTLPSGYGLGELPLAAESANGRVVVQTASPTQALHELTGWAVRHGTELAGITVDRPSLEDVYLRLTSDRALASAPEGSSR